jgi:moderate conductance mechanosensitive channel
LFLPEKLYKLMTSKVCFFDLYLFMNIATDFGFISENLATIFRILLIVVGSVIVRLTIRVFIKKFKRRIKKSSSETISQAKNRAGTLTSLFSNAANIIVTLVALFLVLSEVGVDITPLLAGAGILGLGFGLAVKDLASDMVSGFFILMENQINVGDQVQIGPSEGKIVRIGLRTLVLRDSKGNRYIIPNSSVKVIVKIKKNK